MITKYRFCSNNTELAEQSYLTKHIISMHDNSKVSDGTFWDEYYCRNNDKIYAAYLYEDKYQIGSIAGNEFNYFAYVEKFHAYL